MNNNFKEKLKTYSENKVKNVCIALILLSILLIISRPLTSKYYNFGNPSKHTLYRNAIKSAINTTKPNAKLNGSTFRAGLLFSSEIGINYSKEVGKETIKGGNVTLKFHFTKPVTVTAKSPDYLNFNNFSFDNTPYNNENTNISLDKTMWNTLEKLHEGTVAEAYITFDKLYETEEVFSIFKNKDMNLLWLAVDTGAKNNSHTVLGFPHTQDFPELRRNWFDPPPKFIDYYTNAQFRNEYFINTLEFLDEHKYIANVVHPFDSIENIENAINYVNKNGVKILGVAITGPTKEILKLREENLVKRIIVGETRLWNWD